MMTINSNQLQIINKKKFKKSASDYHDSCNKKEEKKTS